MDGIEPNSWSQTPYEDESASSESAGFLEKQSLEREPNSKPKPKPHRGVWSFRNLRVVVEVAVAALLVALLASGSVRLSLSRPRRYGPTVPRKDVILGNTAGFGPDIQYADEEMLHNKTRMKEIHKNWQHLFPMGRGYVKTFPGDDFQVLHPPFQMVDVLEEGDHYEGYVLAVYHQLHCLSILVTSMGTSREEWKAIDPHRAEHRAHCIEYLRQSILCNGDTTIEGETGSWTMSTGWGQTHSCVDFDALTDMANERAIWDLSDKMLPDSFDALAPLPVGGVDQHGS